ncbi:hypothetical protein GGF31_005346 [Allomyces arbusculus]|nr:hypothetical protein GGF31_005346 [Allomyces arbusculus]
MRPVSAPSGRVATGCRQPSDYRRAPPVPPPPPPLRTVESSTRLLLPFAVTCSPLLPRSPTGSADGAATSSSSSTGQSRWLDQFLLVKGLGVLALVVGSDEIVDALLLDLVHPVAQDEDEDEDAQRAAINGLHVQVFTWLAAFHAEQRALHTMETSASKSRQASAASPAPPGKRPASAPTARGRCVAQADPPRVLDHERAREIVHNLVHDVVTAAQQDDADCPVLDLLVNEYRVPLHAFSEHDILAERDAMHANYPELYRTLELDMDLGLDSPSTSDQANPLPRDFGLEKIMLAVTADPSTPSSSSAPPATHPAPSTHRKYTGLRTARIIDATTKPTTPQWATTRDRIAWLQQTYAATPGTASVAVAPRFHGAEEAVLPLEVAAHVQKQVQSAACRARPSSTREPRNLVRWSDDTVEKVPVRNSRKYGAWYFPPAQWKAVQRRRASESSGANAGGLSSGPAGPASSLSKRIHDLETRVAAAHAAESELLVPRHARSGSRGLKSKAKPFHGSRVR